jgi:hypothetical protein
VSQVLVGKPEKSKERVERGDQDRGEAGDGDWGSGEESGEESGDEGSDEGSDESRAKKKVMGATKRAIYVE